MKRVGISLVIPVYNVAEYLPQLLQSIDDQSEMPGGFEVVFVDDGSTDDGGALIDGWISTQPTDRHRLVRQPNAGVSAARNAGIDASRGEWITFPDGDDVLHVDYLAEAWRFLSSDAARAATLVASRVLRLNDGTGLITNDHPLRFRFENGAHVIDMNRHPDFFQLHAASTFFRRADVVSSGVRFPEGVSASEDALFIAGFLLSSPEAKLGVVPRAKYLYRRRSSGDSATDTYMSDPGRTYGDRFGVHYPALLDRAAAAGQVPQWLQSMLLYEIHWAIEPWQRIGASRPVVSPEQGASILAGFAQCASHLDAARVMRYDATALAVEARLVVLALKGDPLPAWIPDHVDAVDVAADLTRRRHWSTDPASARLPREPAGVRDWSRNIVWFAPTPLWEVYGWRPGADDRLLTSRAVAADRARRRRVGRSAFVLSSRLSDMRVRRVRWAGGSIPLRALAGWIREAIPRSGVSRSSAIRVIAGITSRRRRRVSSVIVSEDAGFVAAQREDALDAVWVGARRGEGRVALRSLSAVVAAQRAARIVADHSQDVIALLGRARPRASRWQLTLALPPSRSYDDELAMAETSVRTLVEAVGQPV